MQRESVNLGIYSCNWTKMDLKFKKILLLTMRINDANQITTKASMIKIVNLQPFANVSFNLLRLTTNISNNHIIKIIKYYSEPLMLYFFNITVQFQVLMTFYNIVSFMVKTLSKKTNIPHKYTKDYQLFWAINSFEYLYKNVIQKYIVIYQYYCF